MKVNEKAILDKFFADPVNCKYFFSISKGRSSFHEIYDDVFHTYPLTSEPYKIFRSWIEENWLKVKYPTEYVLCMRKASATPYVTDMKFFDNLGDFGMMYRLLVGDDSFVRNQGAVYRFQYLPRWKVEWNPDYVQFVVGGLVHTADDKYILLRRGYGEFKGKLTCIMGHMAYTYRTASMGLHAFSYASDELSQEILNRVFHEDLKREALEEAGIMGITIPLENPVLYRPPKFISPMYLPYYHAGFLYSVETSMVSTDIKSMEPEKNEVVIMTKDEVTKIRYEHTDEWLYYLLVKNKLITEMK